MKIFSVFLLMLLISSCVPWEKIPFTEEYEKRQKFLEYAKDAGSRVVYGNPEPSMPDMEKNNSTLLGIDSDDDGLRDDVEIYINYLMQGKGYNKAIAIRMYARSKRKILKNHDNKEKMIKYYRQSYGDVFCFEDFLSEKEKDEKNIGNLYAKQFNTKLRERYYKKSVRQASSIYVEYKSKCRFEIRGANDD